ncbi:hypothetical protein F4777DRAFT_595574 [Nemania sp. FL0916]|nr:hypothetical protein F4777DRAFT_595574 [Nemania sp. FL0916]
MPHYLPDTALTTLSVGNNVYTYAQTYDGILVECQGQLKDVTDRTTRQVFRTTYSYRKQFEVLARYEDDEVPAGAPKLFTPLAAAYILSDRCLFYLDEDNVIRGVRSTNDPWAPETSLAALNVHCAHYSQLTAITLSRNGFQAICLYYQNTDRDAGIEMLGLSTKNNTWVKGRPDMTPNPPPPQPAVRVVDPPLYGTSLTAVLARDGLRVIDGENSWLPVVYLQWDTLALAHSQDSQVETIRSLDLRFAPHTSLTAVDDGRNLYCFYTSSRNNSIRMVVVKDGKASAPQDIATPTPRSSIAAVMPNNDRIVLFYQSLNADVGSVELNSITFVRGESSVAPWQASNARRAKLG